MSAALCTNSGVFHPYPGVQKVQESSRMKGLAVSTRHGQAAPAILERPCDEHETCFSPGADSSAAQDSELYSDLSSAHREEMHHLSVGPALTRQSHDALQQPRQAQPGWVHMRKSFATCRWHIGAGYAFNQQVHYTLSNVGACARQQPPPAESHWPHECTTPCLLGQCSMHAHMHKNR